MTTTSEPTVRVEYTAEYLYPGVFFPESTTRRIPDGTLEAVITAAPADTDGYFRQNGWYAAKVTAAILHRFHSDEDGEVRWIATDPAKTTLSIIVGEKVHVDDIPDTPETAVLRANVRANTPDGYAVHTRAGNWQYACDYDHVLTPEDVTR